MRSLAVITVALATVVGIAWLLRTLVAESENVSEAFKVWVVYVGGVSGAGCGILLGMLTIAFFRTGKRNPLAFRIGVVFGLAAFMSLLYAAYDTLYGPPH